MAVIQMPAIAEILSLLVEDSHIPDPLEANPAHVPILKNLEVASTVIDCVGSCKFIMGITSSYKEVISAVTNVTGREFTHEDFKMLGERVYNMERVFNVREGITRADDCLPPRLLEEPLPTGRGKGHVAKIDTLLDPYYKLRGWDKNGIPTPEKLQELGLENIIKHLS